jgi:hypothetical protein
VLLASNILVAWLIRLSQTLRSLCPATHEQRLSVRLQISVKPLLTPSQQPIDADSARSPRPVIEDPVQEILVEHAHTELSART